MVKFLIILFCLGAGMLTPAAGTAQTAGSNEFLSGPQVTLSRWEWLYPAANAPVAASVLVDNRSNKTIKSLQLLVVAKDKKGVLLQSRGTTLNVLVSKDSIAAGTMKSLYFNRAFDHTQVAAMELRQAIVEYHNGSLEIIKK